MLDKAEEQDEDLQKDIKSIPPLRHVLTSSGGMPLALEAYVFLTRGVEKWLSESSAYGEFYLRL